MADETEKGLARGLTNYGDKDFSLYLRRSFSLRPWASRVKVSKNRSSELPTRPAATTIATAMCQNKSRP